MVTLVNIAKVFVSFLVIAWLSIAAFWGNITTPQAPHEVPLAEESLPNTEGNEKNEVIPIKTHSPEPQQSKEAPEAESSPEQALDQTGEPEDEPITEEPAPTIPISSLFARVNETTRASIVNIFCEMRSARSIKTITGSGVIIDPRGAVLTNAHIAQFFLVKDYPSRNATQCTLRTGNPASPRYKAQVLYLPISWTYQHAEEIDAEAPVGTGEGDYALLYITDSATEEPLPTTFPYIPVNTTERVVDTDDNVFVASYPALVPESQSIKNDLYLISTPTKVDALFTFTADVLDLFAVKGNIAAHHGSSGGAVVNTDAELVGLIVTSTDAGFVLERKLRALTPAYISREMKEENGTTLSQLLMGDLALRAKAFGVTTAPILTKLLTDALKN